MTDPIHLYAHGERETRDRSIPFTQFLDTKEKWAETMKHFPDKIRYTAANLAAHNWDVVLVGDRLLICCVWSGGSWWHRDGTSTPITEAEMDQLYPQVKAETRNAQKLYPRSADGAYREPIYRTPKLHLPKEGG